MGVVYIFAGFLVFIVGATVVYQLRLRGHRGVSREEFISNFRAKGIPDDIPAAVYDHYKRSAIWKSFSVSPDDTYAAVFSDYHEDIDDDAIALVQKLGMEMPIEPVLRQWPAPLKTLGDMVLWLDWVRQHQ